ncbi:MAG: hypothetical protein CYG60_04175 [Actinobacteria bacterium]|nr:MAG: hypothetical protein CYG60_04175 [Actinomycetota bacterium]
MPLEYRGSVGEDLRSLPLNGPEDHDTLSREEQAALQAWIGANMRPAKTPDPYRTSYGLKHRFEESAGGCYVTNGQFKGAMLKAGYEPVEPTELNWRFRACLRDHGDRGGTTDGR